MVSSDYINLKKLTMDELVGVVNLYPWFGSARRELCYRMTRMSGAEWSESQYADAALYIGSRKVISDMIRQSRKVDYSDKDVEEILRTFIAQPSSQSGEERQVRVAGGDYFSQAEYDNVRQTEDNVFSRYAAKVREDRREDNVPEEIEERFCTETLARIFAEQGYSEQARHIYSKLSLANPEKNAYFAALIEKLD